jgi:NAD+--asparagine ADP-ribosyltransferase
MAAIFKEQRAEAKAERAEIQAKMEAERAEMQAKIEAERAEMQAKMKATLEQQQVITKDQLAAVQTRLEGLHASELLSDDELGAVEDCLADFFEASAGCEHMTMETVSMNRAVGTALKLIALSEGMTKDTMFARQVKRKFC